MKEAIHERHKRPEDVIDKTPWLKRLDALLEKNLDRLEKPFELFRKGLVKCRDYIFTFFEDPLIPPDNNASERGIGKLKIKLKNSGVFRSDLRADAFLDLHSVVETAKENGQTAYNAIQALFEAAESPLCLSLNSYQRTNACYLLTAYHLNKEYGEKALLKKMKKRIPTPI